MTFCARRKRQLSRRTGMFLVALVLTFGVARRVNPAATDPAAALIFRARTALGPGLGHVKSLHLAGTLSAGDISGTIESWINLTDGRFATRTEAGPLTQAEGYDGRTAWRSDAKGIVLPQTGPLAKMMAVNEIFNNTYALFSRDYGGASVSYLGTRTDAGKNYEAIAVKPKGGLAQEIWFDSGTALPARTIVDLGAAAITTTLSGYRNIDGLMVAAEHGTSRRLTVRDFYGHEQGYVSSELTSNETKAEADVGHIDQHFAMQPSAINDISLPGGEARIPFTMQNFWILVGVRLNGKGPFKLMLDSGGRNILSPSVAWQIGASASGQVPQSSNIPLVKPVRYVKVESVALGSATLTQQYFNVGGVGNVFTRVWTKDGMIGYELFARFITTVDYAQRQLILRLPNEHRNEVTVPAGEVSLPLAFDDTKPEVACKIADTDASCIIDTGAGLALLLSGPFVKANAAIQPPWFAGTYTRVYGSGGASEVRFGPVSSLQLGPFSLPNVDTLFTTAGNGALAQYLSALVGNRIWRRFSITFDYSHAILRLVPDASLIH